MRRGGTRGAVAFVALVLTGCIPQVAPPPGDGSPYRHAYPAIDGDREPPPPAADVAPPPSDVAPPPDTAAPPPGAGGGDRFAPSANMPIARREPANPRVSALPAPPPAWQAQPVVADAATVPDGRYVVQPGDSLRSIAAKTGAGALATAYVNGIPAPYTIRVGQQLHLQGGRYHMIRPGQTGIAIARAYGVDWSRILTANGLSEPYVLRAGWRLLIPGAGNPSLAERAAAFTLDVDDLVTGSTPAIAEDKEPVQAVASARRVLAPTVAVATPSHLASGFQWPLHGPIVAAYGPAEDGKRNDGVGIGVPIGTPVLAAADGVVAYVGDDIPALGGLVIVKHGDGWTTVYGNASKLLVQRGQSVKRGQRIALSGDSGYSHRPELHFEIRRGRDPVNPLERLPDS